MLELKVRQLTDSQIEFLRRWDAEDSEELRRSPPRSHGFPSPMRWSYARKFACPRCGGEACELIDAPSATRLWNLTCFCSQMDCTAPDVTLFTLAPWTGWKIGRRRFVPMKPKTPVDITRLDIVVSEDVGGTVVWRRGIATFRTIMQACIASPRDVRRLARLQILRSIS